MATYEGTVKDIVEDESHIGRYALIKIGDEELKGVFFKAPNLRQFLQRGQHCKLETVDFYFFPSKTIWPVAIECGRGKYYSPVVNLFSSLLMTILSVFFLILGLDSGDYWWVFGASMLLMQFLFSWIPFFQYIQIPKRGYTKI